MADREVIAVRYGTVEAKRSTQFYRYPLYGQPDAPLQMDYFFWIIRDGSTTTLVDTGFHPSSISTRPDRRCLIPPLSALAEVDVSVDEVDMVVISHCHYDHIGNLPAFPRARFVVQRAELDFWTGPYARRRTFDVGVERHEIDFLAEARRDGRVDCLDGDAEIAEGISVLSVPGHCPGQQIVLVDGRPPVVIASDALHFYEEMDQDMPFNVFSDLVGMYRTYETLRRLASEGAVIVAGHDPKVMTRFVPLEGAAADLAVRIGA